MCVFNFLRTERTTLDKAIPTASIMSCLMCCLWTPHVAGQRQEKYDFLNHLWQVYNTPPPACLSCSLCLFLHKHAHKHTYKITCILTLCSSQYETPSFKHSSGWTNCRGRQSVLPVWWESWNNLNCLYVIYNVDICQQWNKQHIYLVTNSKCNP